MKILIKRSDVAFHLSVLNERSSVPLDFRRFFVNALRNFPKFAGARCTANVEKSRWKIHCENKIGRLKLHLPKGRRNGITLGATIIYTRDSNDRFRSRCDARVLFFLRIM